MFEKERIVIKIPYYLTLPTIPIIDENGNPGNPNPLFPFISFLNFQTPNFIEGIHQKSYRGSWDLETYEYRLEASLDMMNLGVVSMFANNGGKIFSLPLWAKVELSDLIPDAYQTTTDQEKKLNWQQYVESQQNFSFTKIGDDFYIPTSIFGNGDYMEASEAIQLFGIDKLVTKPTIKQLQASVTTPEPEEEIEGGAT